MSTVIAPSTIAPPVIVPTTITLPAPVLPTDWSLAKLQAHLGGIPLERIRLFPPPGMATEEDALRINDQEDVLCELVDGVLVEKVMGFYESAIAVILLQRLQNFLDQHRLGVLGGEAATVRPKPKQMRMPDVSFVRWDRFKDRKLPREKVLNLSPDLAVEILSEGNTVEEIDRKLDEYFTGGTRLAWIIDPETRTAEVYTSRTPPTHLDESAALTGGDVLPGFSLVLRELFDAIPRAAE